MRERKSGKGAWLSLPQMIVRLLLERLDSDNAAIDREIDAGDKTALVRGEEQGRCGNFFRAPQPAEWDHRLELLSQRISLCLRRELSIDDRRFYRSRADNVGTDAPCGKL